MDEYPNNVIMDESTLNHTFSTVELTGTEFYRPSGNGYEVKIREHMRRLKEQKNEG